MHFAVVAAAVVAVRGAVALAEAAPPVHSVALQPHAPVPRPPTPAPPSNENPSTSAPQPKTAGKPSIQTEKDVGYRHITNYAQQSKVINNRSFFLNGNQWTDANVQNLKDAKHTKITFNSPEYFDLISRYADAAQYLSLGSNITLELGGTVYDIVEETPAPK